MTTMTTTRTIMLLKIPSYEINKIKCIYIYIYEKSIQILKLVEREEIFRDDKYNG